MKSLLIFIPFFLSFINLSGQPHEYSSKVIQAGYLITKHTQGAKAGFSVITKHSNINSYSLAFNAGILEESTTNYKVIKADYKYLYTLISKNPVFLNAGGGGFISYELTKNEILEKNKNKFSPGICAVLEFEVFFSNNAGIFISYEQLYRPISIIGNFEYRISTGLKYIF